MKKITISLIASAAVLASTAALADSPAVREMNSFSYVLKLAAKSRAAGNPSEFVIYRQEHPCPPKGKHEHKKEHMMKHHHHHHHGKKMDEKKADENKASESTGK